MRDPSASEEQAALAAAAGRLAASLRAGTAAGPSDLSPPPGAAGSEDPGVAGSEHPAGPAGLAETAFPADAWRRLAGLGAFEIGTAEGGGASGVLAVAEALGGARFPGPVPATYLAAGVLEGEPLASVLAGEETVSLAAGVHYPWGNRAAWLLRVDGDRVSVGRRLRPGPTVRSMAGEPWDRPVSEPAGDYALPPVAAVHGELALAGYLSGAAAACLAETAAYAGQRRQFGRRLGDFQAVSHALARCEAELSVAGSFARRCAWECDHGGAVTGRAVLARGAVAAAAVTAALQCHQVYGAMGFSAETRLWQVSTRIREWSLAWPGQAPAVAGLAEARRLVAEGISRRSPAGPAR